MMKVLIGIDGSAGSLAAVQLAGGLLSPESDEVLLYYSPPKVDVHGRTKLEPKVLARLHKSLTDAVFDAASDELPSAFREKTRHIAGTKKPAHGLLLAAEEHRADMIVLGAHGNSKVRKTGIGSVGRHVVHAAHVPVLVARPRDDAASPPRVMLACDQSDTSRNAGRLMNQLSWPEGAVGRVMTVVESLVAGSIPEWLEAKIRDDPEAEGLEILERSEEQVQNASKELCEYFGELPESFQNQTPIVSEGHAAQEILRAVAKEKIDLVVMGARSMGLLGRLFFGSTSEHILTHSQCSVLIVREHEQA